MKIIENMPIQEYHAHDSISKSGLDKVNRSISHYLHSLTAKHEPTRDMKLGTAIHAAALEPDLFHHDYIASKPPQVDNWRITKAVVAQMSGMDIEAIAKELNVKEPTAQKYLDTDEAMALVEHYMQFPPGSTPDLDADDVETAQRCADAIHAHPKAAELLQGALIERSIFWTDPETGLELRVRPDVEVAGSHLADIKSTGDASERAFASSMAKFRYHVQEAMYLDGTQLGEFYFIAVEKYAPYEVAVYYLTGESSARGYDQYREDLDKYAAYLKAKADKEAAVFTGYSQKSRAIDLPGWA